jgi:hypothetical protein
MRTVAANIHKAIVGVNVGLHHVFFGPTLDPNSFWEPPTSPSNLSTTLPPTNPPTSLTPLTSVSTDLHR